MGVRVLGASFLPNDRFRLARRSVPRGLDIVNVDVYRIIYEGVVSLSVIGAWDCCVFAYQRAFQRSGPVEDSRTFLYAHRFFSIGPWATLPRSSFGERLRQLSYRAFKGVGLALMPYSPCVDILANRAGRLQFFRFKGRPIKDPFPNRVYNSERACVVKREFRVPSLFLPCVYAVWDRFPVSARVRRVLNNEGAKGSRWCCWWREFRVVAFRAVEELVGWCYGSEAN